ncbi:MAG TPA: hypothetical protein VFE47_16745, partial [Tepidisphaeraceae bacterium]|nr:hypothetical protein [Tepidisphaeraceae bacterium]
EAFRDGLEDYEYLWTLNDLLTKAQAAGKSGPAIDAARELLTTGDLIGPSGAFANDASRFLAYRAKIAEAIVRLKGV